MLEKPLNAFTNKMTTIYFSKYGIHTDLLCKCIKVQLHNKNIYSVNVNHVEKTALCGHAEMEIDSDGVIRAQIFNF